MNFSKKVAIQGFLVGLSLLFGTVEHQFSLAGMHLLIGLYLVPLLVVNDLFGFKSGFWSCFAVCLIRMLFLSNAGVLGFLLYLSPVIYMLLRKRYVCSWGKWIFFDFIGVLLTILCKIPLYFLFLTSYLRIDFIQAKNVLMGGLILANVIGMSVAVILSRLIDFRKYLMEGDNRYDEFESEKLDEKDCN